MALKKDDIDGLEELLQKSEAFSLLIFDWVAPLKHHHLLGEMYDFRTSIETELKRLKELPDDTEL